VHDENAFAIAAFPEHAGVFRPAPDLAAFCQICDGGLYAHENLRRATAPIYDAATLPGDATRVGVPTKVSSGHYFRAQLWAHVLQDFY